MLKSKLFQAILLSLISVVLALSLVNPVYSSDDDVSYMFILSGALGKKPDYLLSVLYGWHPIYGFFVKNLFKHFPRVNWYTVFLGLFHIAGLGAIIYYLFNRLTRPIALLFFLLFFCVFEIRFLQNPDFTTTAMVGAMGGCLLLALKNSRNTLVTGMLLLLLGLLLRFHISVLVIFLFAPIILQTSFFRKSIALFIVGFCWLLLFWCQVLLYQKEIPDWKSRASFRDAFFYQANHPINSGQFDSTNNNLTYTLFRTGFLYDETRINTAFLKTTASDYYSSRNLFSDNMKKGFYWFFIESRILILILILAASLLFLVNRPAFWRRSLYLLHPFIVFFTLTVFFKNNTSIIDALFLASIFYFVDGLSIETLKDRRNVLWATIFFSIAFLFWGGKKFVDRQRVNITRLQSSDCLTGLLRSNRDKVFVASGFGTALRGISAWSMPRDYNYDHFIYYQRSLFEDYRSILNRHGLPGKFPAWLLHPGLRLIGKPSPVLSSYCMINYGLKITFTQDTGACLPVYKVLESTK